MNEEKVDAEVTVKLRGKEYSLLYTFHSVKQFKLLTGHDMMSGGVELGDIERTIGLLWAGLIDSNPDWDGTIAVDGDKRTPDSKVSKALVDVAKLVDVRYQLPLAMAINKAISLATPEGMKEAESAAEGDDAAEKK